MQGTSLMASFNIGTIKRVLLPPTQLALPLSTIQLLAKPFMTATYTFWSHTVGSATARDVIPSGTNMEHIMEFEVLEPMLRVGDVLELFVKAGLDTMTINVNNVACGRFCFEALNTFANNGIIREDWMEDVYRWHKDICNADIAMLHGVLRYAIVRASFTAI
ncbi:hypothetical protein EDD85DRAFT_795599 [Armillaria nabsnona]|nr:hypothetical protein EDD85DRAFT_795599 [Armillaria nabsnona]